MEKELKDAIDGLGSAAAELKTAHAQLQADMAKHGGITAELQVKFDRINTEIDKHEELKTRLEALEAAKSRIGGFLDNPKTKEFSEAFNRYARKNDVSGMNELCAKGMSVSSDPGGGYTVHAELATEMIKIIGETSQIRQIASQITIGTDAYEMQASVDEATTGWVGEMESRTETTAPTFDEIRIPVHEQYAAPTMTQKLIDDSVIDIESWLIENVTRGFSRTENAAFVAGNGVKKPSGFMAKSFVANASYAWGTPGYITSGAAADWAASAPQNKLYDIIYALKPEYLANASWVMARARMAEIRQFANGIGEGLWRAGLEQGQPSTLAGYPLFAAEDMPAKAANAFSVAFGDFKQAYQIVDRAGITILRDPYTTKGKVMLYTTKRVGGDVKNFEAYKVMKWAA